jgi:hypothetical protein
MKRLTAILAVVVLAVGVARADNEVNVSAHMKVKNGYLSLTRQVQSLGLDQTNAALDSGVAIVTSSATNAIAIVNVTDPSYLFMRNVSTSGTINVSLTIALRPGEMALCPLGSTNIIPTIVTNSARLDYSLIGR